MSSADEIDLNLTSNEAEKRKHKSIILRFLQSQIPTIYKLIPFDKFSKKDSSQNEKIVKEFSEEKPKKKFKVIHAIIAIGILFMAFEEQILGPELEKNNTKEEHVKRKLKKKKSQKTIVKKEGFSDQKNEEKFLEKDTNIEVITKKEVLPIEDNSNKEDSKPINTKEIIVPADNISDINSSINEDIKDIIEQKPTEKDIDTNEIEDSDEVEPFNENTNIVNLDAPQIEIVDDKDDKTFSPNLESGVNDITETLLKGLEQKAREVKKQQVHLEDIAVNEPQSAPNYEISGRALVYNCIDAHWACIDTKSFVKCKKNYEWNKKQEKKIECFPKNIYDSDIDCEKVQQFNVTNDINRDFC
ncbi:MAG: hypothetical protein N4A33_11145 [Bacteriovoracaceae bacterium]|jgi:hypothetical protein|nr:hypothetical protein [Bacteriovoracaceae bacterium]